MKTSANARGVVFLFLLPLFYNQQCMLISLNHQYVPCIYAYNVSMGVHMFLERRSLKRNAVLQFDR